MKFSLLFAIVFSSLSAFAEVSLRDVADGLGRAECYMADTRYEVYLPNASEPVTYRLHISGTTAPGDTLAPLTPRAFRLISTVIISDTATASSPNIIMATTRCLSHRAAWPGVACR